MEPKTNGKVDVAKYVSFGTSPRRACHYFWYKGFVGDVSLRYSEQVHGKIGKYKGNVPMLPVWHPSVCVLAKCRRVYQKLVIFVTVL